MNSAQLKYAREKINSIFYEKAEVIRKKYEPPQLTQEEVTQRLKEGRFTVIEKSSNNKKYNYGYLSDYVIIEGLEQTEEVRKLQEQRLSELNKAKLEVMDELVLGDADGALELLKSFRDKEF